MDAQSRLLGAHGEAPHWGNLGAWRLNAVDESYNEAACRLAQWHAEAIALCDSDRLLELGAGSGASLRLWARYGVREVITLDRGQTRLPAELAGKQGQRISSPNEPLPIEQEQLFHHRGICTGFDDVWPALTPVDAVICVDALYHARALVDVLSKIAQQLTAQGRWAITLIHIDSRLTRAEQFRLRAQLHACGMAWTGLWHSASIHTDCSLFQQAGLSVQRVDDLTHAVLSGFADAIAHRRRQLTPSQRCQPTWWKLSLTARLCRSLVASGTVRYVLVAGTKHPV